MVKDFLKQFFLETFKRREKEEYQDLIAMNRKTNYPWFYLRIIVFIIIPISFLTILFHVFYLSTNIIILIYGAIFISFALFILLYELIKTREITFLQIMLIILFSGLIITPLVSFFYCYIPVKGDFLESVRAGTIEEIAKGIVACLLIYFINKQRKKKEKNKLTNLNALLIGASCGVGFAIGENFAYFLAEYIKSFEVIRLTFSRGFDALCTHLFWTGIIAYFFNKFNKPLINFRFYLAVLLMMLIHTIWDINTIVIISDEIYLIIKTIILIIYAILSFIYLISLIKKEEGIIDSCVSQNIEIIPLKRLITVGCLLLLSFNSILYLFISDDYKTILYEYNIERIEYQMTKDEFIDYIQDGHHFEIDRNHPFNADASDCIKYYIDGKLVTLYEYENFDDYMLEYVFVRSDDDNFKLDSVMVWLDDYVMTEEYLVDEESDELLIYYPIEFNGSDYILRNGDIYIKEYDISYHLAFYCFIISSVMIIMFNIAFCVFYKNKGEKNEI
ncbi:MAG: PrsW family intramembrane metalloprotease [Bacilli bacterium]|nr:PrsW family intramembrane metalloprotease [Bacilli bacterium]